MCADDYIVENSVKQELFAQTDPHFVCQCRGRFWEVSERKGYQVKCCDPRCSKACLKNFCHREQRVLSHFLEAMLPDGHAAFRGNLTLVKNATPDAHRKVRASFLRALQRRCPSLRIRCNLDITDARNAHYDFTAYGPAHLSADRIKASVAEAWAVAGGKRSTCRPLHDGDQRQAWATYTTKSRKRDDRWRFVPARNRLPITWGTDAFFGPGVTKDDVHAAWVRATFPRKLVAVLVTEQAHDEWAEYVEPTPSSSNYNRGKFVADSAPHAPLETPSAEAEWKSLAGDRERVEYHAGSLFDSRMSDLQARFPDHVQVVPVTGTFTRPDPETVRRADMLMTLPPCPSEAVTAAELAHRTGWDEWQVRRQLDDLPGIKRLDWTLTPDGYLRRDLFYRPIG